MIPRICVSGLVILGIFYQCSKAAGAPQSEVPTLAKCKDVIKSSIPSIVQFTYPDDNGKRGCYGCGVIVSREGHVIASCSVGRVLDNVRLNLRLTDGRQVTGEALGWSHEFNVGMFKITEPGSWPFVEINEHIHAGDVCLSLGYSWESRDELKNNTPEVRLSVVNRVAKNSWFTTPQHARLTPHPVFDVDGKLIGLARGDQSSSQAGEFTMHVSANAIRQHWEGLLSGSDLDRQRLLELTKSPDKRAALPEKMSGETLSMIKAACVKIGEIGEKPSFSGVVVDDGYVVTCAHHHRLPGTDFNVEFANGKTVVASLLYTNWLTDVGVLKVKGKEDLPIVGFGDSGSLSPGDTVLTIGYPHRSQQQAIVLETKYAPFPRRNKFREMLHVEFYSAGEEEEIAKGLSGVSGGGVFDSAGNLIGIHKGIVSAGAGRQFNSARVELFRANWKTLTELSTVDEIDADKIAGVVELLKGLKAALAIDGPGE